MNITMKNGTEFSENWTDSCTSISKECLDKFALIIFLCEIVGLVMAVFGIIGQVTAAIVLVQPSMRNSTSILLVVMAAFDILLLTIVVMMIAPDIAGKISKNNSKHACYILYQYLFGLIHICHTGTVYMTVLVTIERAVVVLFPFQVKRVCTKTRAAIASVVVLVWSMIYSIPQYLVYVSEREENGNQTEYRSYHSDFSFSHFYNIVYLVHINNVFHFILPAGVIIILNTAIIKRLYTNRRNTIRQMSSRADSQLQLTAMIIALTTIFCGIKLMHILALSLYPFKGSNKTANGPSMCFLTEYIVYTVANIGFILNSAANFFIYNIFGHKFRRCLKDLLCSKRCTKADRSPTEIQRNTRTTLLASASCLCGNIDQHGKSGDKKI